MRRAVRVKSQLKSHKRFAMAFPRYCQLVDHARLYCTDAMGIPPKVKKSPSDWSNDFFLSGWSLLYNYASAKSNLFTFLDDKAYRMERWRKQFFG